MNELRYSTHDIDEADIAAVVKVLRSDWLTRGPTIERFEAALAEYCGAKYAVVVSSGTAALHLAYLAAHKARLCTTPLSFAATANAALFCGMDVTFHDVDRETGNVILPGYVDCLNVPVHFAGHAAPIPTSGTVIEDACHAIGAVDFDGCSRVGSCAHSLATCFSFHPVKPMTSGEGGAITTNDQGFADEARMLRSHGRTRAGEMVALGFNYRLTDIQAALGITQLERLGEMHARRIHLVCEYRKLLPEYGMMLGDGSDAWHLYPIRIKGETMSDDVPISRRDKVKAILNSQGIMAQVHYSPPIHLQPYYRKMYGYREGMYPEAEAWAAEELSLPLHPRMTEGDVRRVVDALRGAPHDLG
jgi:dTDP-4-amino-4,6-dideoxygalactose transaminase